jgi:hypothetical protein
VSATVVSGVLVGLLQRLLRQLKDFRVGLVGNAILRLEQLLEFGRRDLVPPLADLFEQRILCDLLRNHVLQFQPVELEDPDHLHERRRQNLLLFENDLQLVRDRVHPAIMIPLVGSFAPFRNAALSVA